MKSILELVAIDTKSWGFAYKKEINDTLIVASKDDEARLPFSVPVLLSWPRSCSCGFARGRGADLASPRKPVVAAEVLVVLGGEKYRVDRTVEIKSEMAVDRIGNGGNDSTNLGILSACFRQAPRVGSAGGFIFSRLELQLYSVALGNHDLRG